MTEIYEQPPSDGCNVCGSTEGLTLRHGTWHCAECRAKEEAQDREMEEQ